MAKELKFLYESSVNKVIEEKVTEKKTENGETIEITKTVKTVKPIKIAILKPLRRTYEEAEIYYAKQIAIYIKGGLLPYSLVAKRYANDGGPLSDPEKERLGSLRNEARELEGKFFEFLGEKDSDTKAKNDLLIKINAINSEISNIQNAYADIFENTAEMKARNKTIEWWVLNLSYIDEDSKGYKPIFGEGDFEAKLDKYDVIDEETDAFLNECIRKLSYLTSFWCAARTTTTAIDFASMDKLYMDNYTDYKVEEPKIEIKVTSPDEKLTETLLTELQKSPENQIKGVI